MHPSPATDLKTFLPTKDAELFKRFYTDLGFHDQLEQRADCRASDRRVPVPAGNFMMSLAVEDADAWWEHIQRQEFAKKYPGIMCKPPAMQPWGIRVLYLSDPTGVLWDITDMRKS